MNHGSILLFLVYGLETALQHAGGRSRHWTRLFSAVVATFRAVVGQAVSSHMAS